MGCGTSKNKPNRKMLRQSTMRKGDEFKVVLIGDKSVGKTSIVNRYTRGYFSDSYEVTIGSAYKQKIVNTPKGAVNLDIWDTAGEERFRALLRLYYRDASVVIIVYDVNDSDSFHHCLSWSQEIRNELGECIQYLVGNKIDNPNPVVTDAQADEFAQRNGLIYKKTSAKSGEGISELFEHIALRLLKS